MVKQSLGVALNGHSAQGMLPEGGTSGLVGFSGGDGMGDKDKGRNQAGLESSADSVQPLKLSEAERVTVRYKAIRGLVRVLMAQALMVLFAVVVSWAVAGLAAGASALVGAGAYFVPNALFAVRLLLGHSGIRPVAASGFLVGELIKLASSVLLLVLVVYVAQDWLVWPAMLFGLVCVLKGYVLLLMFHKLP